jgi:hypothetical protein
MSVMALEVTILAYFPKMKLLNCLVDFHETWYGGNVIQGDLDEIIFNPISSTI